LQQLQQQRWQVSSNCGCHSRLLLLLSSNCGCHSQLLLLASLHAAAPSHDTLLSLLLLLLLHIVHEVLLRRPCCPGIDNVDRVKWFVALRAKVLCAVWQAHCPVQHDVLHQQVQLHVDIWRGAVCLHQLLLLLGG
jgi:hypothetical protein